LGNGEGMGIRKLIVPTGLEVAAEDVGGRKAM
jgi:hypothetical protein